MERELIAVYTEENFILDYQTDKKISKDRLEYQEKIYKSYIESKEKMLFDLAFDKFLLDKTDLLDPSIYFLFRLGRFFIEKISTMPEIEYLREDALIPITKEEINWQIVSAPFAGGSEHINPGWIGRIWDMLLSSFYLEIASYRGTISEFLQEKDSSLYLPGRVYFHLVENRDNKAYPFAFLATYSVESSKRKINHLPLKNALIEYKNHDDKLLSLLSTVSSAAQKSDLISELMESGELFSPLKFSEKEAYTFLKEIPLYEESQILCRIPEWWKKNQNRFSVSINIGEKNDSKLSINSLVSFNPTIRLGEESLSKEEIEAILQEAEGLLLIKGKWVEVNHERLRELLEAYELAQSNEDQGISLTDAMRAQKKLSGLFGDDLDESYEISYGKWLEQVVEKLRDPSIIEDIVPAKSFKADLRKYQETGLKWLSYMNTIGFGSCLADDMGLGKTVQVIGLFEQMRQQNEKQRVLLIIPASLIGNWKRELDRFSPSLKYKVLHKSDSANEIQIDEDAFVHITTYGMCSKLEELKEICWDLVVIDEAQAIKNPGTKQTKSVKAIQAGSKIAMTGTPIENRLSDLWSLFDFLNPGLLGTSKEFASYTDSIKTSPRGYQELRDLVSPFILRRLKTDKNIISDLPDKIEIKEYPSLSNKQLTLYKQLVNKLEESLDQAEGIGRKGLVLTSIMKFKQICNHPDQFLGQKDFKPSQSGKFILLEELCQTIKEKRERVLIFTQFKEMTEALDNFLASIFEREGLVLHGGTPIKKRAEIVEEFQADPYVPYLVLSLKAGGVGLNLTRANHVIHFDRWWNPSVENQATDRAFRIGQTKDVLVHKLISEGTIEEKIDNIIEGKEKLARDIISGSDENWILNMNNKDLINLFRFGGIN